MVEPTRIVPLAGFEMCERETHQGTGRTAPTKPGSQRPGLQSAVSAFYFILILEMRDADLPGHIKLTIRAARASDVVNLANSRNRSCVPVPVA